MAFTLDTTLGTLLDDPQAKAVLDSYLPGVADNPMVAMAKGMSLNTLLSLPPTRSSLLPGVLCIRPLRRHPHQPQPLEIHQLPTGLAGAAHHEALLVVAGPRLDDRPLPRLLHTPLPEAIPHHRRQVAQEHAGMGLDHPAAQLAAQGG